MQDNNIILMNNDELFDLLDEINYEEEKKYIETVESIVDQFDNCIKCGTADHIVDDIVQGYPHGRKS
jgi:hypothetical protein